MKNENDVARSKHLDSTAVSLKRFILENNSELIDALLADLPASSRLDSVPATVDGGLWFETTDTAPIIKFKQGGSTFYLYTNQLVSPNLTLSSSTVTTITGTNQTVTLTYSGEGTITLSNPNITALTASYNSSTKTITLTSNLTAGDDSVTVNLGVVLSESGNYATDSQTLAVTCSAEPLDPQLTVTPSETTVSTTVTATVSYLGTGTISVTPNNPGNVWYSDYSYDANTHTLTITYSAKNVSIFDGEEFTVSLSAADGYAAATATLAIIEKDHGAGGIIKD